MNPSAPTPNPPLKPAAPAPAIDPRELERKPVAELTPEEQMAIFEKDQKENDWGHQPC
jgi:hypothetical protein